MAHTHEEMDSDDLKGRAKSVGPVAAKDIPISIAESDPTVPGTGGIEIRRGVGELRKVTVQSKVTVEIREPAIYGVMKYLTFNYKAYKLDANGDLKKRDAILPTSNPKTLTISVDEDQGTILVGIAVQPNETDGTFYVSILVEVQATGPVQAPYDYYGKDEILVRFDKP